MNHSELIQTATDLLSESIYADLWLPFYDAALSGPTDAELNTLVDLLRTEIRRDTQMPAAA